MKVLVLVLGWIVALSVLPGVHAEEGGQNKCFDLSPETFFSNGELEGADVIDGLLYAWSDGAGDEVQTHIFAVQSQTSNGYYGSYALVGCQALVQCILEGGGNPLECGDI